MLILLKAFFPDAMASFIPEGNGSLFPEVKLLNSGAAVLAGNCASLEKGAEDMMKYQVICKHAGMCYQPLKLCESLEITI